jgi:hypothetical protein
MYSLPLWKCLVANALDARKAALFYCFVFTMQNAPTNIYSIATETVKYELYETWNEVLH